MTPPACISPNAENPETSEGDDAFAAPAEDAPQSLPGQVDAGNDSDAGDAQVSTARPAAEADGCGDAAVPSTDHPARSVPRYADRDDDDGDGPPTTGTMAHFEQLSRRSIERAAFSATLTDYAAERTKALNLAY